MTNLPHPAPSAQCSRTALQVADLRNRSLTSQPLLCCLSSEILLPTVEAATHSLKRDIRTYVLYVNSH